jgi:hypothetical protein
MGLDAFEPIPASTRFKAYVCGRLIAGIVGSNPAGGVDVLLLWIVCCQVEVSVTGRSFVQRNPTECMCVCVCVSLSVI